MKVPDSLAKDIEIACLRCELFQLRADAEWKALQTERDALIEHGRQEVNATADAIYDLQQRGFLERQPQSPVK